MALPVPTQSVLQMSPPTFPYPALSAEAEPISKEHCRKLHHEVESLITYICAMGPKELNSTVLILIKCKQIK